MARTGCAYTQDGYGLAFCRGSHVIRINVEQLLLMCSSSAIGFDSTYILQPSFIKDEKESRKANERKSRLEENLTTAVHDVSYSFTYCRIIGPCALDEHQTKNDREETPL